jgi:hypothetical protein
MVFKLSEGAYENHEKPQDTRCPGRDSNPVPHEYSSEALLPEPTWSVGHMYS